MPVGVVEVERHRISARAEGIGRNLTISHKNVADSGEPDVTFSATAQDLLLLLARREDPDTLFFSRRLVIEGDTELGLTVKNLLDAVDPDSVLARLPAALSAAARRLMAA